MPGVETNLATTFAAAENSFGGARENVAGGSAAHDDFDHLMRAAVAPASHKPPAKAPSRADHHSTSAKSPHHGTPSPGDQKSAAENSRDDESADIAKSETEDATGTKSQNPASAVTGSADVPSPLPSFLSLPFFFNSLENRTQSEKSSLQEKPSLLPNGAIANGEFPTSTDSAASDAGMANGKESKDGTGDGLPLNTLAAATAAETKVPESAPATCPEKNATAAETRSQDASTIPGAADSAAKSVTASENSPAAKIPPANPASCEHQSDGLQTETAAEPNGGTGVATTDLPMKNSQKTNKVAGQDVKVLPVGDGDAKQEKDLPTHWLVTVARAASNGTDLNFNFSNGNGQPAMTESGSVLNAVDLPSLADAKLRSLERAHDMVALHAMRLVESKSDVLSVVIKPSVGTELSLELRQRDGGVEAQATLMRGDHEFMSQHWADLQHRLEQRGIKLAELANETNFSANDNGYSHRQPPSPEDAAQEASAFAEFASATSRGGASARVAVLHDGWESWA